MRLLKTAATSLTLLLSTTCFAADRYQVRAPSFGCVLTWTTWAVNDQHNPRRHDPRWLRHVIDRGQCRMVGPNQQWEPIGRTNGLLSLRPVPALAGVTSLYFRPNDLQRSSAALGTPVPVPVPVPVAPSVSSQDLAPPTPQPAPATDPAAAAAAAIPPAPTPVPDTAPPPVVAPTSVPEPSTPEPSLPTQSGSELPATAPVTTPPSTETAPPVLPDVQPPTDARPATADATPASRPASTGTALVIGLVVALIVLAGLVVLAIRRRNRRRLSMRRQERSSMERLDAQALSTPGPGSDLFSPPIDMVEYRQRCVKSLGEAGWQARMSFPAGGLTADIIARRDGRLLTMQCRPSTRPLESVVVQEALIVRRAQDANLAAVVSNAGYTKAARSFAAASGVRLLHETELPEFIG